MRIFGLTAVFLTAHMVLAGVARADNLALVIGPPETRWPYFTNDRPSRNDFTDALEDAGFRVLSTRSRDFGDMMQAARTVEQVAARDELDRLVIVLSPPYASSGHDSWVLSRNAIGATSLSIGSAGVSLSALTDLARAAGDRAVMLMATDDMEDSPGFGLKPGLGAFNQDDGVTYVTGLSRQLLTVLEDGLLREGLSIGEAADQAPAGVKFSGFVSYREGLMGPVQRAGRAALIEEGYWQAIQGFDTVPGYRQYLDEYPSGAYSEAARSRIAALQADPSIRARAIEEALGLTRDGRREVQRGLSILGLNPRGIDGIFGPGTRAAIRDWQGNNGFDETGYLSGNQLALLRNQAETRAAELEEEARRRREQQELEDRAYWRDTGRNGDEAGLRAYLERYPDGLFAELAEERLASIEQERRAQVAAAERQAWDKARSEDTIEAYRKFLDAYPSGGFADAAKARLRSLEDERSNSAQIERDKAEEAQIASKVVVRLMIEQRLAQHGADPGQIDGKFNKQTRRAIRNFQKARDLPVTGYVSQATMVRLLSGR